MDLDLISPMRTLSYQIAWLEAQTEQGSIVIQRGHAPTMLVLAPGKELIFRLKTGKQESITVEHGILEVARDKIRVIIKEYTSPL